MKQSLSLGFLSFNYQSAKLNHKPMDMSTELPILTLTEIKVDKWILNTRSRMPGCGGPDGASALDPGPPPDGGWAAVKVKVKAEVDAGPAGAQLWPPPRAGPWSALPLSSHWRSVCSARLRALRGWVESRDRNPKWLKLVSKLMFCLLIYF